MNTRTREHANTRTREHANTRYRPLTKHLRKHVASPEDGAVALAGALFGRHGDRPGWQRDAACAGMDPTEFDRPTPSPRVIATCASCPVRQWCLNDQLDWETARGATSTSGGELATTRSGLSPDARAELHQQRAHDTENQASATADLINLDRAFVDEPTARAS